MIVKSGRGQVWYSIRLFQSRVLYGCAKIPVSMRGSLCTANTATKREDIITSR